MIIFYERALEEEEEEEKQKKVLYIDNLSHRSSRLLFLFDEEIFSRCCCEVLFLIKTYEINRKKNKIFEENIHKRFFDHYFLLFRFLL